MTNRRVSVFALFGVVGLLSACGGGLCDADKASVADAHRAFALPGGTACKAAGKRQLITYPMSLKALKAKYGSQVKLRAVECSEFPMLLEAAASTEGSAAASLMCGQTGQTLVGIQFYGDVDGGRCSIADMSACAANGDAPEGESSAVAITVATAPVELLGKKCQDAAAPMTQEAIVASKGTSMAFMKAQWRCESACNAGDSSSCSQLGRVIGGLCESRPFLCEPTCGLLKGPSAAVGPCSSFQERDAAKAQAPAENAFKMTKEVGAWNELRLKVQADPRVKVRGRLDLKGRVGRRAPGLDLTYRTDDFGKATIRFKNIPPGEYTLFVFAKAQSKNVVEEQTIKVTAPEMSFVKRSTPSCADCLSLRCRVEMTLSGMKKPTQLETTLYHLPNVAQPGLQLKLPGMTKASMVSTRSGSKPQALKVTDGVADLPMTFQSVISDLDLYVLSRPKNETNKFKLTFEMASKKKLYAKVFCAIPEKLVSGFASEAAARKGFAIPGGGAKGADASALVYLREVKEGKEGVTNRFIIGRARVPDLDYLVYVKKTRKTHSSCAYTKVKSNERTTLTRSTESVTMTIYDRRTGKKLASDAMNSPLKGCPTRTTTAYNGSTYIFDSAVKSWVQTALKKLP